MICYNHGYSGNLSKMSWCADRPKCVELPKSENESILIYWLIESYLSDKFIFQMTSNNSMIWREKCFSRSIRRFQKSSLSYQLTDVHFQVLDSLMQNIHSNGTLFELEFNFKCGMSIAKWYQLVFTVNHLYHW